MSKEKRGGSRKGAGRPALYREMKAMKVPTDYIPVIKALISHLNETDMVNKYHNSVISEGCFFRSKQDHAQYVKFITEPIKKGNEVQLDLVDYINNKEG